MPSKIVPNDGAEPGQPFNIIDTPDGRLVTGSVALFRLNNNTTQVQLDTGSPYKTAKGRVPTVDGAVYEVSVRRPDGQEFSVGTFRVIGGVTSPTISPTAGLAGEQFTITDPQGRMTDADRILFTQPFADPATGRAAGEVSFSADGKTATATVPDVAATGYLVTVHEGEPNLNPPLFAALNFRVNG
jgi:hypothetical protein